MALYRDGSYLAAWSPFTNTWLQLSISFGTTPIMRGSVLLIPEADRWIAVSAHRGVADELFVTTASTTMRIEDSLAWVRDGSTVHAFSAFSGRWHSHSVPTSWAVSHSDRLLVFWPGTFTQGASAFDALNGTWHDLSPRSGSVVALGQAGSTALAILRNGASTEAVTFTTDAGWRTQPVRASTGLIATAGGDRGDLTAAADVVFSGLRRTLHVTPTPASVGSQGAFARGPLAFLDTAQHSYALSAGGGGWQVFPVRVTPIYGVLPSDAVAAGTRLYDGSDANTYAFDCVRHTPVATPGQTDFYLSAQFNIMAAMMRFNSNTVSAYSAITGQWFDATVARYSEFGGFGEESFRWRDSAGIHGYSARTGTATPAPVSSAATWLRPLGGVWDQGRVWIFDARGSRWQSVPFPSPTRSDSSQFWGAVAFKDDSVLSWSTRTSSLATATLGSNVSEVRVTDGGAMALTADRLYAASHVPDHFVIDGFPYTTYACGPGTTCHQQLRLPTGSAAITAMSTLRQTPISLPAWGDLWLEPTSVVLSAFVAPRPGEHRADLSFDVPDLPSLRGTEWALQSLILPAQGTPYLTDTATFLML